MSSSKLGRNPFQARRAPAQGEVLIDAGASNPKRASAESVRRIKAANTARAEAARAGSERLELAACSFTRAMSLVLATAYVLGLKAVLLVKDGFGSAAAR